MKAAGEFIHNWVPTIIYILVVGLLVVIGTAQRKKQG